VVRALCWQALAGAAKPAGSLQSSFHAP
jgi:hypothetical protein